MTPNEKPIIFSGAMVKSILDGRKTQTRRVIKPQPKHRIIQSSENGLWYDADCISPGVEVKCPYGGPGDRLWVRETFQLWDHSIDSLEVAYKEGWPKASKIVETRDKPKNLHARKLDKTKPWKPSIYMPRWASRITLQITEIRVERVQDITEEDARKEGCERATEVLCVYPPRSRGNEATAQTYRAGFRKLWNSINAKRGFDWYSNCWVWCITFRKL